MTLTRRQFLGAGAALGAAWLARPLTTIAADSRAMTLAPGANLPTW